MIVSVFQLARLRFASLHMYSTRRSANVNVLEKYVGDHLCWIHAHVIVSATSLLAVAMAIALILINAAATESIKENTMLHIYMLAEEHHALSIA